jgi:hypothetical protein
VRTLDPDWRPQRGAVASVEGLIREGQAQTREAQARFEQLRSGIGGNFGPPLTPSAGGASSGQRIEGSSWIAAYRAANSRRDLFGNQVGLSEQDTVATAEFNGRMIFGTNSEAHTFTAADRGSAQRHVDILVDRYPGTMNTGNVGWIPNNALYHAEATILLRAARDSGGTLSGRTLEVHIDRNLCPSCRSVLPKLGLELGNPDVTFVGPNGVRQTMRHGYWLE